MRSQPVVGFHVASVHSMALFWLMRNPSICRWYAEGGGERSSSGPFLPRPSLKLPLLSDPLTPRTGQPRRVTHGARRGPHDQDRVAGRVAPVLPRVQGAHETTPRTR